MEISSKCFVVRRLEDLRTTLREVDGGDDHSVLEISDAGLLTNETADDFPKPVTPILGFAKGSYEVQRRSNGGGSGRPVGEDRRSLFFERLLDICCWNFCRQTKGDDAADGRTRQEVGAASKGLPGLFFQGGQNADRV